MEAAGPRRHPDLARRAMPVDDHLRAVGELDLEHAAVLALDVGVDAARLHGGLEPRQGALRERFEVGLVHGVLTSRFYAFLPSRRRDPGAPRRVRAEGPAVPARQPPAGRKAPQAQASRAGALPGARGRSRKQVMSFDYRDGVLCAEQAPLDELARRFGTPCYVYSSAGIGAAY